jgi:hypothetical protein
MVRQTTNDCTSPQPLVGRQLLLLADSQGLVQPAPREQNVCQAAACDGHTPFVAAEHLHGLSNVLFRLLHVSP